jgi:hypothetical protein
MWPRWDIIALAVCLITLCGLRDVAAYQSTRDFLRQCEALDDEKHATLAGWCLGYVEGVLTGYFVTITLERPPRPSRICLPTGESKLGKVVDRLLEWLRRHPESHEQPLGLAVLVALFETHPCPSGDGKTK